MEWKEKMETTLSQACDELHTKFFDQEKGRFCVTHCEICPIKKAADAVKSGSDDAREKSARAEAFQKALV